MLGYQENIMEKNRNVNNVRIILEGKLKKGKKEI